MATRKRKCYTCRQEYEYCPDCLTDYNKPKWMFCFCSEECKDVYNVISNYNTKESNVTQDDVVKVLKKYNVKDVKKYAPDIQKELKEITNVSKKNNKKPETSEEV